MIKNPALAPAASCLSQTKDKNVLCGFFAKLENPEKRVI